MIQHRAKRWARVAALTTVVLALSGCAWMGENNMNTNNHKNAEVTGVTDAAGMTQQDVARLTPQERFELYGKRYVEMQELLADAQHAITPDPWLWGSKGIIPTGGGTRARWAMPGSTSLNSYTLEGDRILQLPGATGDKADTAPMVAYFESQGWRTMVNRTQIGDYQVLAMTDNDEYGFEYTIRSNGNYSLNIFSQLFWGDRDELSSNIVDRIPETSFDVDATIPGEYIPFPNWNDPIINNRGR